MVHIYIDTCIDRQKWYSALLQHTTSAGLSWPWPPSGIFPKLLTFGRLWITPGGASYDAKHRPCQSTTFVKGLLQAQGKICMHKKDIWKL